jgi:hypothetical protein
MRAGFVGEANVLHNAWENGHAPRHPSSENSTLFVETMAEISAVDSQVESHHSKQFKKDLKGK